MKKQRNIMRVMRDSVGCLMWVAKGDRWWRHGARSNVLWRNLGDTREREKEPFRTLDSHGYNAYTNIPIQTTSHAGQTTSYSN